MIISLYVHNFQWHLRIKIVILEFVSDVHYLWRLNWDCINLFYWFIFSVCLMLEISILLVWFGFILRRKRKLNSLKTKPNLIGNRLNHVAKWKLEAKLYTPVSTRVQPRVVVQCSFITQKYLVENECHHFIHIV